MLKKLGLLITGIFLFCASSNGQNASSMPSVDSGYLEVGGARLHYVVKGKGFPCLIIGSSIYYPRTFSARLAKHLRMYFVDLKWFAEQYTSPTSDTMTIASIVDEVSRIQEALKLTKPILLGHSIHGTIAMEYAKKHSDKISGLIVIGSPCKWGNSSYDSLSKELWATASAERQRLQEENWGKLKEIDRLTGQKEAAARYNNMSPQYWYNPRYDAGWLWAGMTVHSELTRELFTRVFKDYNMFQPEVPVLVPVFLALGKFDYVIPHTLWKSHYRSIPDFKYVLFGKSGHTPQLEERDLFDQKLISWLKQKFEIR